MKKIEKINNQIIELRQKQSDTYIQASEQAHKVLIDRFFKPQGVYFNMGHNEVRVRPELGNTRYNTKNERPDFIPFEFIFNNNSWNVVKFSNISEWKARREGEFELGVEFNVHSRYGNGDMVSTGDNLKQLAFFGLVADLVENEKLAIVDTMLETFSTFESVYNRLQDEIDELEMHIRVIKEEEKEKAQKDLLEKLSTTGVEIKDRENSYPFEYGYKKTIWAPKHIKITKRSASGKSATIEVEAGGWDGKSHTVTYDRVRVENIVNYVTDCQK